LKVERRDFPSKKVKTTEVKIYYKFLFICMAATLVGSCESKNFESDKRQIIAKDEIRNKIIRGTNFDVVAFREDTLLRSVDSNFIKPILYTLDIVYKDSGRLVQKKGLVLFTPTANQVISSTITDP